MFCERKRNGNACRVNIQRKFTVPRASAAHYIRSFGDIVKQTAGTAGNNALIGPNAAVVNLVNKFHIRLREAFLRILFDFFKELFRILQEFMNCVCIGRMERQGDHRLLLAEVNRNHSIVISDRTRMQLFVSLGTFMSCIEFLCFFIRFPN